MTGHEGVRNKSDCSDECNILLSALDIVNFLICMQQKRKTRKLTSAHIQISFPIIH